MRESVFHDNFDKEDNADIGGWFPERLEAARDSRWVVAEKSAIDAIRPMVEAYRLWAVGRMNASDFGAIADIAVIAFDDAVEA